MEENVKPTPENSWITMSERDILQAGKFRDWDNRELVIIAGSLQRCAKALESSTSEKNYTELYFNQQNDIDDLEKDIILFKDKISSLHNQQALHRTRIWQLQELLTEHGIEIPDPMVIKKKWWQKIFS